MERSLQALGYIDDTALFEEVDVETTRQLKLSVQSQGNLDLNVSNKRKKNMSIEHCRVSQ